MPGQVCADASLVLMFYLTDPFSPQARALWRSWAAEDVDVVSAPLFFAEVTSVLRTNVYFGRLSIGDGEAAFAACMGLGIRAVDPVDLQPRAWALARQYNRPRAYDAQYLAVAQWLGCELWTGDQRLVNGVQAPWLRWIGSYTSQTT